MTSLPRRDFFILPLLSIFTVVALFGITELAARVAWPEVRADSCRTHTATGGERNKPNCVSRTKLFEGPWTTNSYNECGYRSNASCGVKPRGTIRIAVLGTSAATGTMVPYEQTTWAITERELSRACGKPVEVQNLSVFGGGLNLIEQAHRVNEALALQPDAVILMASGADLPETEKWARGLVKAPDAGGGDTVGNAASADSGAAKVSAPRDPLGPVKLLVRRSSAMMGARYFLYQQDQVYLKIYLGTQGEDGGYLHVPFNELWKERSKVYEGLLQEIAEKTRAKKVPFVLIPSIFRAQVVLLSGTTEMPGIDARAFDDAVTVMARKTGTIKFDVQSDFSHVADAGKLFYRTDGHFTAAGHAIMARLVVRQVLADKVLARAGCAATSVAN